MILQCCADDVAVNMKLGRLVHVTQGSDDSLPSLADLDIDPVLARK
jgi:hypothetical protein